MSNTKNQAKDAIRALCHILNASGSITMINPERFRQGKFDKGEAVAPLLTLFRELLEHDFETLNNEGSPSHDDEELARTLLLQCGYQRGGTPSDASELGSRDILMAIGWLLAQSDFVNKQVKEQLHKSSSPLAPPYSPPATQCMNRPGQQQPSSTTHVGRLRYLVWTMGRLRLTLKALHSEQQALCGAMHRVHRTTQRSGVPPNHTDHLTAWDAFLLRHPKQMKDYIEKMEKESSLLQACLSWKELEPVFWQWMVSVHEAKQSRKAEDGSGFPSEVIPTSHPAWRMLNRKSAQRLTQLGNMEFSLVHHLQRFETDITSRNTLHVLEQVPDCPDVAKRKADIENSIKAKLAVNVEELLRSGHRNYPLHAVQFAHKPEQTKHRQSRQNSEPIPESVVDIKSEILRLTDGTRRLQKELRELRLGQQQRLDGFSESLAQVVCIPPMSEKASFL